MKRIFFILLLIGTVNLVGCGQSGPLYIPQDDTSQQE